MFRKCSAVLGSRVGRIGSNSASAPTSSFWRGCGVSWKSAVRFGVGTAVGAASVGCTMAFCKPKDTPDYLLPYYLRDCRSRFNHYASIKSNGRRYMSPEDFLLSILASPNTELSDDSAAEDIQALFNVVDRNNDGRISFKEYGVLMVLLSTSITDFELAFKMFDEENKGSLTIEEFHCMLRSFGDPTSRVPSRGALYFKLFGESLETGRCTFDCFKAVVEDLQTEVTKAEFRQYDPKRTGTITSEHFGKLISDSMLGSHLPFFIVDNLRKMRTNATAVKFSTWLSFSKIMRDARHIGEAVQLYTAAGLPLYREDFNRAIVAVGLPKLTPQEVELVFALFDKNGDGSLEYEEFVSVMETKGNFHVKPKQKDRRSLYSQLVHCTLESLEP